MSDKPIKYTGVVVDHEAVVDDPNVPKLGGWYRLTVSLHRYRLPTDAEVEAPLTEEERERYAGMTHSIEQRLKVRELGDQLVEVLGCITHIGSNFAELKFPYTEDYEGQNASHMWNTVRVHLDAFAEECTYAPDGLAELEAQVQQRQQNAKELMQQMQKIAKQLNVTDEPAQLGAGQETAALSLRGDSGAITAYRGALLKAKERTFPLIQKKVQWEMRAAAALMNATMFPLEVQIGSVEPFIERIKAKVFKVDLYAGLSEEVVQVRDGAPAEHDAKIHVFQRRHYMDEECLLNYTAGGMRFDELEDFDAWLAQRENMERILPHPRSVVAFRVRRESYHHHQPEAQFRRKIEVNIFDEMEKDRKDKLTFIYLRNGEQLFRFSTRVQFDEKLFPDLDKMTLTGTLYFRRADFNRGFEFITEHDFETRKAEEPGRFKRFMREFKKLQPSETVYYDDAMAQLAREMEEHNRLVLILQGLLDRSQVFAPHPQWLLWEEAGFRSALVLVHDTSRAIAPGAKPDFKAYFDMLAAQIRVGTATIGQEDVWLLREGEKECNRRRSNWRISSADADVERFRPAGNPGPGLLAKVVKMSRDLSECTFEWTRAQLHTQKRYRWSAPTSRAGDQLPCRITVDTAKLFNADAYQPGDYKKFFADPRTRAEYLKWAPFLLTAEDYKAKKAEVGTQKLDQYDCAVQEGE